MKTIQTLQEGSYTKHYIYGREEKLYFGIELEFDGRNVTRHSDAVARDIMQTLQEAGIKANNTYDGTVNGREIVLHPCTYSVLESRSYAFVKIARLLQEANYTNQSGKAGGHIHISRRTLGKSKEAQAQTIDKMIAFFRKHRQGIKKLSRRTSSDSPASRIRVPRPGKACTCSPRPSPSGPRQSARTRPD